MKKNLKVILTIGIPGSGKSTWAKEYVGKNPDWVRLNRDDFRFMLKDMPFCDFKVEDMISEMFNDAILKALTKGFNVIIDNTNLKAKYIRDFVKLVEEYADVDYVVFDTPAKVCIERDKLREKKVGENIILRMEKDYKILVNSYVFQPQKKKTVLGIENMPDFKSKLPDIVIVDVDGTLASMNGKKRGPFDWDKVDTDEPNEIVIEQTRFHKSQGRKVILMSGRDESCREITEEWLKFYGVEYDLLYMRPAGDFRKDNIIKEELYNNHIKDKYNVLAIYDDRKQVVDMWYNTGLYVFNVNQGGKIF